MQQPINGKAKWIAGSHFTIDAKADGPATAEFKLKMRREAREVPVYELTVAKGGPKLQAATEGGCTPQTPEVALAQSRARGKAPTLLCGGFHVSGKGCGLDEESVTMADLCIRFALSLERDVIDKTWIQGMYAVHLELTLADIMPNSPPAAPAQPIRWAR